MSLIFSTHQLHPKVTRKLSDKFDYKVATAPISEAILKEGISADILIVRANIPPEYFQEARQLRAAIRHGAGLDMIPVDIATKAGVLVANVPGANARTVAEHAIFAAIALLRGFRKMDRDLRTAGWDAGRTHSDLASELTGRTIGIVGMGNVGRQIFQLAHCGFCLPVISHTRRPENLPENVRSVNIDQLVEESDIIILCCPLSDETRGLIDKDRIACMKPGAIIVNVSRGPVIDESALVAALQKGQIAGAALDVFDRQPLDANNPLFDLDNVIITPHMAGITQESMLRMGSIVADEAIRILSDELPINLCNPQVVEKYRKRFPI